MLPKTGLVYSRFTAISSGVEVFSSPRKRLFLGGSCVSAAVPFRLPASSSSSVPQPVQSPGEEGFRSLLSGLGFFPGERPEVKVPPVQKALSQGRGTLWLQDCSRLTQAGVVIY